jgi:hypothetical protein
MPTIREILFSTTLTADERLRYRLPVALAGAAALLTSLSLASDTLGDAAGSVYHHLDTDYGCATTHVPAGGGAIDATLAVRGPLRLPAGDANLRAELTYAGQSAQAEYTNAHHGDPLQPGAAIESCVTNNPLNFGNGGWAAKAHPIT